MAIIFTIGYEGADLNDFLNTLQQVEVDHLLDIRELPQSRRRGFSKRALADALAQTGIKYTHIKQLGDPKHGREAARRGDIEAFEAIFEAHLDLAATQESLKEVSEMVVDQKIVLLCYERDPKLCHRSLVARRLKRLAAIDVTHLGVRKNGSSQRRGSQQEIAQYV